MMFASNNTLRSKTGRPARDRVQTGRPRSEKIVTSAIKAVAEMLESRLLLSAASLVYDVNHSTASSSPAAFLTAGNELYFNAVDGVHGSQVWKSDGTAAGTAMVTNIPSIVNPKAAIGSEVFLGGTGGLWVTNGTLAGTTQLSTVQVGSGIASGSHFFFAGTDTTHGTELWESDGTAAGTVLLKDINPGTANSSPTNLAQINGEIYFSASSPNVGAELWKSDGTAAGTLMVKDINTGLADSSPYSLVTMGGKLYFLAHLTSQTAIFTSDGTASGTQQVSSVVADAFPNLGAPVATDMSVIGNTLYFQGTDSTHGTELWKSDGTSAGTSMVADLYPGAGSTGDLSEVHSLNGKLYFWGDSQLWQTDGTSAGTVSIAQQQYLLPPSNVVAAGNYLYYDSPFNGQLWRTDGTTAGTTLVSSNIPRIHTSGIYGPWIGVDQMSTINGAVLFNGWTATPDNIELLEITSGSSQPALVEDINTTTPYGSNPNDFVRAGNQAFFVAWDGTTADYQLWVTDGTAANTRSLLDLGINYLKSPPISFTSASLGNSLLFIYQNQLWSSDGTVAGTQIVTNFPGSNLIYFNDMVAVGNRVFFAAADGDVSIGNELWVSDGTAGGTHLVKDINPGPANSVPTDLTAVGNTLYFQANDGVHGTQLWMTDGTAQGTVMLSDANTENLAYPAQITAAGSTVYLNINNALWKSDGTVAGTIPVGASAILSLRMHQNPVAIGSELYFVGTTPASGTELWESDGTTSGTQLVADLDPGPASSSPRDLTAVGNKLYFAALDAAGQYELFKSDGTSSGTIQLTYGLTYSDVYVNTLNALQGIRSLTAAGNVLFFAANDTVDGDELWRSDGTSAGTFMVQDIGPGDSLNDAGQLLIPDQYGRDTVDPLTGIPQIVPMNGFVLFAANDHQVGQELWRATTAPILAADAGGPYQVSEGQTLTLSAAGSETAGAAIVSYQWDLNYSGDNGNFTLDATGVTANLSNLDGPSTRVVAVRVTDANGNVSLDTATVQVFNVAPTLTMSGPPVITTTSPNYTLSLSSSDPGPDTISSWNITWGDGTTQVVTGNPSSVTHVYPTTAANYQITATATDEDGTYNAPATSVQVVQPASISGTFFYDTNGNGIWDSGEAISPSWGVFLDTNGDGIYESGEPELICNSQGQYTFSNLLPGTYRVHPTTASNWTETAPPGGTQVVNAISGQTATNVNFGEVRGAAKTTASSTPLFTGDSYSVNLSYGGFHSVTSWTLNWGDGSGPQTITGSPTSASHTYTSGSGTSPFTILAWANTVDGDAPAAPLTLAVYAAPLLNNGLLSLTGTSGNDSVSFTNSGGLLTLNLDGATKQYNSSAVTKVSYASNGGNDTINLSGAIPATLNLASGNSTVTNSDTAPVFVAAGTGKTTINATAGTTIIPANSGTGIQQLDFAAINISAGAKVVFANTNTTLGNYSNHANRTLAIVDAGGLNIATGGTLDLGDNSMLLKYLAANKSATDTMVNNLLSSGYAGGAWSGTGINSSEANYDAYFGSASRAVGWADQFDVGVNSFEGDSADVSDGNEIMIKFTYYGDTDLDGKVASSDSANFSTGVHLSGNAYWEFGDFDYSGGKPTASDSQAFSTGLAAYKTFGLL